MHPRVHVEAIVYSGRPNPAWDLSAGEAADFVSRIDALPVTTGFGPPDGLGYSGLDVTVRRAGEVRHFRIAAGLALLQEIGRTAEIRRDAKRGLELWLLRTGRGSLDPSLLDYLVSSVESPG